jgi:hypothetical protein
LPVKHCIPSGTRPSRMIARSRFSAGFIVVFLPC